MKIKLAAYGLLMLLLLLGLSAFHVGEVQAAGMQQVLVRAETAGGILEALSVEARIMFKTDDNIEDIANNILKNRKNFSKAEKNTIKGNGSISVTAGEMTVVVKRLAETGTCLATVSMSQDEQAQNINDIRDTISMALSCYKAEPNWSELAVFKIRRKMAPREMKRLAEKLLVDSGASFVHGINGPNLASCRGYLRGIKECIELDDNRMNINVGMHAMDEEGGTLMYIGSPVIAVEY